MSEDCISSAAGRIASRVRLSGRTSDDWHSEGDRSRLLCELNKSRQVTRKHLLAQCHALASKSPGRLYHAMVVWLMPCGATSYPWPVRCHPIGWLCRLFFFHLLFILFFFVYPHVKTKSAFDVLWFSYFRFLLFVFFFSSFNSLYRSLLCFVLKIFCFS